MPGGHKVEYSTLTMDLHMYGNLLPEASFVLLPTTATMSQSFTNDQVYVREHVAGGRVRHPDDMQYSPQSRNPMTTVKESTTFSQARDMGTMQSARVHLLTRTGHVMPCCLTTDPASPRTWLTECAVQAGLELIGALHGEGIIPIKSAVVRDMVTANALEMRIASPKRHLGLGEEEGGSSHRGTVSCGTDSCWLTSGPDKATCNATDSRALGSGN